MAWQRGSDKGSERTLHFLSVERKDFPPVRGGSGVGLVLSLRVLLLIKKKSEWVLCPGLCGQSLGPRKCKGGVLCQSQLKGQIPFVYCQERFCCLLPDPVHGRMDAEGRKQSCRSPPWLLLDKQCSSTTCGQREKFWRNVKMRLCPWQGPF